MYMYTCNKSSRCLVLSIFFLFKVEHCNERRIEEELNATGVEQEVTVNLPVVPAVISGKSRLDLIL